MSFHGPGLIERCLSLAALTLAGIAFTPDAHAGAAGCNLGNGRVASVVAVDGGCVAGPTGNNVQSYDVQEGKTYTVTLTNVTDCANGGTDATIQVMVKNSTTGNVCYTATNAGVGIYTFDHTMPAAACNTSPIDYCTIDCDPSTGLRARRGDGDCAQVHLRAAAFGDGCANPVEDSDCTTPPDEDVGDPFCFGDGTTTTACPCAPPDFVPDPPAAPGSGCANSLNLAGAQLTASGTLSPDTLQFSAFIGPSYGGFAFLVVGNGVNPNGVAASDGVFCVTRAGSGHMYRFGAHASGTNGDAQGTWTYPNTAQTTPVSVLTGQAPGQHAYYQLYYRDTGADFCNPSLANFSNAIDILWP